MAYDDEDARELGLTLMSIRRGLGLTQNELAERCRVSGSTLARHENGEDAPSLLLFRRYCRQLGLLEGDFFRIHRELCRARARLLEGPVWVKKISAETDGPAPAAKRDADLAEEVAASVAQLAAVLFRARESP
ncbi:MAG: helix-turn-helix transcriptional regulator [Thermoanaerobaculia bacterium]|nr:helix-turn-helix transcriptional regulator [Thermoanaerobaculia bacterium]